MSHRKLNQEDRSQIYILRKEGYSQQAIADAIGVDQSAISRELMRNCGKKGYRPKQAQELSEKRRKEAHKPTKMTADLIALIEPMIREKHSPEQISGWLKENHPVSVSHETIYLHIWADKKAGGDLYTFLRRRGKAYQPRGKKLAGRGCIKNRVGIEHRPAEVDAKERVGDWEIDLVIGHGHSGALVTIVERFTKFTVSKRVNDKSAASVTKATIELLSPYQPYVLTITADNGKEFAFHEQIAKTLDCDVFFADPYCSWQRGLNENTNGLLRQYWPKKTDFKLISQHEVAMGVKQLNDRPRKLLFFKSPAELMEQCMSNLAA